MTPLDQRGRTPSRQSAPVKDPSKSGSRALGLPVGLASIVAGLVLWEILVRLLNPSQFLIVPPSEIAVRTFEIFADGTIWRDLVPSMQGFFFGYVFGALAGIPLGLVVGASERIYKWANPWVSALYATPIIGLAPLFIISFGFGLEAKVAVVLSIVIFPILINTTSGARAVSVEQRELAFVYRANRFETFTHVMFPGALPFILTGLRLAVGRGLIGVVVADLFGAVAGLGLNLQQSAESFDTVNIFAVTVILAFLGIVLTGLIERMENRAYKGTRS